MKAVIVNFRGGVHTQYGNQMIIDTGMDKEKAAGLIGKKVSWKSSAGKEIAGKVSAIHGRKGAVRAIFERGMPGQAVGSQVEIV